MSPKSMPGAFIRLGSIHQLPTGGLLFAVAWRRTISMSFMEFTFYLELRKEGGGYKINKHENF